MLSEDVRHTVAETLATAERDRAPIPPLRETWPDLDVVDSYTIQLLNIGQRLRDGAAVRGHKVGLSSKAMQDMMGVDEPDYGHLLSDMEVFSDTPVSVGRYCMPRVEMEVAFVLGRALPGEGCTEDDVLASTDHVTASIELIDSRIDDWNIKIMDTIADNASSAGFVLGASRVDPGSVDLTAIDATLFCNGEEVAAGRSDAVLGNPVTAVAWLARKVATFGVTLEAGHVILPGSVHRAIDAHAGDDFEAVFSDSAETNWGSVKLSFTE
jgi:2-keto-4-pentenoate hydratase